MMNEQQIVGAIGVAIYGADAIGKTRLDMTAEDFRTIAGVP